MSTFKKGQPVTKQLSRKELLHLLRRTLFGVKISDLQHFEGKNLGEIVDELLTFNTTVAPPLKHYGVTENGFVNPNLVDETVPFGTTWVDTPLPLNVTVSPEGRRVKSFRTWWLGLMVHQERNLREKMVLFWHNHIVTETIPVAWAESNYQTNKLLRDYCLGNFKELMFKITLDVGMLRYLNGNVNTKTAPDENYGRELQELFCVGKGPNSYTEKDVKAAARVLTGWRTSRSSNGSQVLGYAYFTQSRHDTTDKQFSSFYKRAVIKGDSTVNGGRNEIQQMLDMIFAQEEVAHFICRKLFTFFVDPIINAEIEEHVIQLMVQVFRENMEEPDQMKKVMRVLLTNDFFFHDPYIGCQIKSPLDYVVGSARLFELPIPGANLVEAQYEIWYDLFALVGKMGQDLGDPPNVAGWPAYYQHPQFYKYWMDTATYPERQTAYETMAGTGFRAPTNLYEVGSRGLRARVDWVAFVAQFQDPVDPNTLLDEAVELMFGVTVSQPVKDQLKLRYLLQGQVQDHYWSDAWSIYINNPSTSNPDAAKVPTILKELFTDLQSAAESHLF